MLTTLYSLNTWSSNMASGATAVAVMPPRRRSAFIDWLTHRRAQGCHSAEPPCLSLDSATNKTTTNRRHARVPDQPHYCFCSSMTDCRAAVPPPRHLIFSSCTAGSLRPAEPNGRACSATSETAVVVDCPDLLYFVSWHPNTPNEDSSGSPGGLGQSLRLTSLFSQIRFMRYSYKTTVPLFSG